MVSFIQVGVPVVVDSVHCTESTYVLYSTIYSLQYGSTLVRTYLMRLPGAGLLAAAGSLFALPLSTVHVVGDVYLDIIAKVDELPTWDGDTTIRSPMETVAGGSALNTAAQLSALIRTRRQRDQARPFRRCILHSRVGADLYGDLVASKLREAGVKLSGRRTGAQGVCICLSGERDRSFVSFKGTVAEFCEADLDLYTLLGSGTSHVHVSWQHQYPCPCACTYSETPLFSCVRLSLVAPALAVLRVLRLFWFAAGCCESDGASQN